MKNTYGRHHNAIVLGMCLFITLSAVCYLLAMSSYIADPQITEWNHFLIEIPAVLLIGAAMVIIATDIR